MSEHNKPKWLVYISGALTDMSEQELEEKRQFYIKLGDVCHKNGFEPYLPHLYGDPIKFASLTPQRIDRIDRLAVVQSRLVVAYVGKASLGVGIEVEMAFHSNKPVILLFEKGKKISRLVRGNPAVVREIPFTDQQDAYRQLDIFLSDFNNKIRGEELPTPLSH